MPSMKSERRIAFQAQISYFSERLAPQLQANSAGERTRSVSASLRYKSTRKDCNRKLPQSLLHAHYNNIGVTNPLQNRRKKKKFLNFFKENQNHPHSRWFFVSRFALNRLKTLRKIRILTNADFLWHTLSKSIRRASFFGIDPCFSVNG
jgi:hypothetical protein